MTPKVEWDRLSHKFITAEGETEALRSVSLRVAPGEFVALVGPSGCGKSTLLSLTAGLLRPTAGCVRIDGEEVATPHHAAPTGRTGYMLQRDSLMEWRTVLQNVLLGPELRGQDLRAARARADALLCSYGLDGFQHHRPRQLSGGMRQRVALIRTLALNPEVVLLDEPFSAIDYQTRLALQDEVWSILRQAGKTVLMVTHDISEAIAMADRVVVLSRRPATIRAEHRVELVPPGVARPSPLRARTCPPFQSLFQRIWEELELHVGAAAGG